MIRLLIRYLLLLCFIVSAFGNASAQAHKIDSLRIVLKTLPADTNRVNVLIELCKAQSFLDSKEIISTANEALALAKKINFKTGQAKACFQLGYYFHKVGDDLKAIESLHEASNIFEKVNNLTQAAYAYNAIGVIYNEQDDEEEALLFFQRANSLWSKVDFREG
ncbi:MAG TPA: tetratricopeptide repeat protein, partial [Cyclobacteriaceae bacterium]|nr:tetratricopeptide repeat protein [Cyclobacteriaceae bacterium]